MEEKKTYGLATVIAMIVGIVIGSGIYFRADDIFKYTNGNLPLGLLVLALGALCIVFGSLTLTELSKRYVSEGGLVGHFEKYISPEMAAGFGWFQLFIWLPSISVVIAWAGALYTFMLLGIEASLLAQVCLGLFYNMFFLFINILSKRFGGFVQRFSTAIKLIPLALIAVYGMFFANPQVQDLGSSSFSKEFLSFSWITALVPLAFSYDGWTISMTIAPEIKDAKKNMVKALVISPFIILLVYLLYIYGISNILGSAKILELGDAAIFEAGKMLLGDKFGNILLVIVIISVLGVVNGVSLGAIRVPQAMAEKKYMPDGGISHINQRFGLSIKSTLVVALLEIIWAIAHYLVMKYEIFNGRDVSEISIVFSYISYILLYYQVYKILIKEGQKKKVIIPILATLGSLIIFVGSLLASPFYVSLFILICSLAMYLGYQYAKNRT